MFGGGSKASRISSSRIILLSLLDPNLKSNRAAFQVSNKPRHLKFAYYTIHTSLQEWKRAHMEDFAKMSAEFRKDLELPESKMTETVPSCPESRHSFSAIVNGVGILLEYPDFMVNSS
ncbi:hypothetical protein SADUNF_SadunfUnG0008300 [Salix dunnii]|uniref:Uncharacterized protein n=1 Tax=Salix dunnii TaxID=1413687 RepID=A0A835MBU9_9ROSI|nr:hypothetical protein SADUNF_SadunfUnG0008300 [Salix dunnii]